MTTSDVFMSHVMHMPLIKHQSQKHITGVEAKLYAFQTQY
jgi:hypothetical protein